MFADAFEATSARPLETAAAQPHVEVPVVSHDGVRDGPAAACRCQR
ncbi:hypothetical protein ACTMU2_15100 [Cupriavidus basilensis]